MAFAGTLLIESPKMYGIKNEIIIEMLITMMMKIVSLILKYGWNLILSVFLFNPNLFLEP